jgi:flagellar motility protein MotE (MotC chaperone)
MDPLTAIGLAGSIVQFVSFSHELVSLGKEIYKSSEGTREHVELDTMIKDLSYIHKSLLQSWAADPTRRSEQENNIASLVTQCEPIYKELRRVLASLQVQGDHRKWKSFCKALKSVWKEDQINSLEKRLQRLQQQIDSHLIANIRLISPQHFNKIFKY